ncbi:MAG: mismatch-specific DNA-glycosylase [Jatrophihabitans sp.]
MILPDYLHPGLRAVLVGTVVGGRSAERGHYYAGVGNNFWRLLHESGLTPTQLRPQDDATVLDHGLGLTDLVKTISQSHDRGLTRYYDVPGLVAKVAEHRPTVVAFTSKTAAAEFALASRLRAPRDFGPLSWAVADRPAFVLPGPSSANNGMPLPLRIALWADLADFIRTVD